VKLTSFVLAVVGLLCAASWSMAANSLATSPTTNIGSWNH
jgi:hypothetical protein